MKYKVDYQFKTEGGKWLDDCLNNNGKGFDFEDAECVACEVRSTGVVETRWVEVVEM